MVVQISAAVIAAAVVVLVVYAIIALRSAKDSLQQATRTIANMESRIDEVSRETVHLLQSTHQLTEDVNSKLARVDNLFESVSDVGQAVQQVTSSVKQVSATVTRSITGSVNQSMQNLHTHQNKVDAVMQWANAAIMLWQKVNSLRSNAKQTKETNEPNESKATAE